MTQHEPFSGTLPDGWQGGEAVTKKWNGDFIHLYRVRRACKTCNAEIKLDVTKNALMGFRKNAGLLLRNCPTCRAERKNGGPGSRGGKSRPVADAPSELSGLEVETNAPELETLRMANHVMREELEGLYATVAELKSRLALYELPAAMHLANGLQQKKMPWE
jgi:hypothetical protein